MRTVEWDCVRGKQVSFLISSVGSENRLNIYWIWLWEIDLISKQQFAALHKAVGKFILDILTNTMCPILFSVSIRKWSCHSGTCERKYERWKWVPMLLKKEENLYWNVNFWSRVEIKSLFCALDGLKCSDFQ